ncbi:C45 family autoproteolytic acyltransferase/hydolase [Candidatus Lokiarchaeum ossiferum]|uniref:C45 family autoproteolytic acyltransferase/hydolase n=1 Tax=Candidatus Lokiarchaeum ossiferum TaxID=2951803 RepID=UPI00352C1710
MKKIEMFGSISDRAKQLSNYLLPELKNGYPPQYSTQIIAQIAEYEEIIKKFSPDLYQLAKNLANELNVDYRRILAFEFTPMRFQTACQLIAIGGKHTIDGQPLLVKVQEWRNEDAGSLRLCYSKASQKLQHFGVTFHWPLLSRYGGINDSGLAISNVSASFDHKDPGIMANIAIHHMLENFHTVQEAVEYLQNMPKVWGAVYLIMDKDSTIAKVEVQYKKTKVTYSTTGFEYVSLLYDDPEMLKFVSQDRYEGCYDLTVSRKKRMVQWLEENKGDITPDKINKLLQEHEHKMCVHDLEGLVICWAYILKPGQKKALVCQGRPCENEFKSIATEI